MEGEGQGVTPLVVYDCMVLLQAAGSPHGPAGRCWVVVAAGAVRLCVSTLTLAEFADVVDRPFVRKKFRTLTDARVAQFRAELTLSALVIDPVPEAFTLTLTRDPRDSKYLNLAIAAGAKLVVSRDDDLLDLMTGADPDAVAFRTGWPAIAILDPVSFLATLAPPAAP